MKNALIYSLATFCSLLWFSSARAQFPCTPVVYAFRHAEDVNEPAPHLTPVGSQHADLYPSTIESFGQPRGYCPVGFVYSTYNIKPDGGAGTNNPYETAEPLGHLRVRTAGGIFRID